MMHYGVVYRTVGEDATFFSNRTPVADAKTARCEVWESATDEVHGQQVEPVLWIQCGEVAAQDHEGSFLCEEHMVWWHCEACEILTPEQFGPYHTCARCRDN